MGKKRLVIGITGATGTIFGVRMLELLQDQEVETHLIISAWGARTLTHETPFTVKRIAPSRYPSTCIASHLPFKAVIAYAPEIAGARPIL